MNKLHHYHPISYSPRLLSCSFSSISKPSLLPFKLFHPYNVFSSSNSLSSLKLQTFKVSDFVPSSSWDNEEERLIDDSGCLQDLAPDSPVYQKTLRLVECSMFAAVAGLTYLLSNSLAIEVRFQLGHSYVALLSFLALFVVCLSFKLGFWKSMNCFGGILMLVIVLKWFQFIIYHLGSFFKGCGAR